MMEWRWSVFSRQSYFLLGTFPCKVICVKNVLQIFLCLMFLVLGHETMSWACSCVRPSPCGVHRYGDADFLGEVLSRERGAFAWRSRHRSRPVQSTSN